MKIGLALEGGSRQTIFRQACWTLGSTRISISRIFAVSVPDAMRR